MSERRILVTGGAGYIGGVAVEALVDGGYDVTVLDNLTNGHRLAVHPEAHFVQGDISDPETVRRVLGDYQIGAVLHFAALIEAGQSMKKPAEYFRNNVGGTTVLLEAMADLGVEKIVFSSTAAVYGNPKTIPIEETAEKRPTNAYGATKLAVEGELGLLSELTGLQYAALRYFNACGATENLGEDHHPETHLIPIALQVALGERPNLQIFGKDFRTKDGTGVRDYVHVADLASAHLLALEAILKGGRDLIYNLGTGNGFSNREVVEAIRRVSGKKIPCVDAPRREGDPAILVASSAKIKRELGWTPRFTTIEEIVSTAWEWRNSHPRGYV